MVRSSDRKYKGGSGRRAEPRAAESARRGRCRVAERERGKKRRNYSAAGNGLRERVSGKHRWLIRYFIIR